MSNAGGDVWFGPFESREAFEGFQDESIGRLIGFAMEDPQLSSTPEHLRAQLWEMGKYMPAAILGLGRYNPDLTLLHVYREKAAAESRNDPDYYKTPLINPGPTILRGQDAYERMVNSWHVVDDLTHQHRFAVRSAVEVPSTLEIVHSGKSCLIMGAWMVYAARPRLCSETVWFPDTSRDSNTHDIKWAHIQAYASDGWGAQGDRYTTTPFSDAENDQSELTESAVELFAGKSALKIVKNYGRTGFYQQRFWSNIRQLLGGLSPGPDTVKLIP